MPHRKERRQPFTSSHLGIYGACKNTDSWTRKLHSVTL